MSSFIDNVFALLNRANTWTAEQNMAAGKRITFGSTSAYIKRQTTSDPLVFFSYVNGFRFDNYSASTKGIAVGEEALTTLPGAGVVNALNGFQEKNLAREMIHTFCNVNYSGGVPSINSSRNVSSLTDYGVGALKVNFTTTVTYSTTNVVASVYKSGSALICNTICPDNAYYSVNIYDAAGTLTDPTKVYSLVNAGGL